MNLRGDILTIMDIRGLLGMPSAPPGPDAKVMVAQIGEIRVGIIVEEADDVTYLRPAELKPAPASARSGGEEYLKGAFPFKGVMLEMINLEKMLTGGELLVDETV